MASCPPVDMPRPLHSMVVSAPPCTNVIRVGGRGAGGHPSPTHTLHIVLWTVQGGALSFSMLCTKQRWQRGSTHPLTARVCGEGYREGGAAERDSFSWCMKSWAHTKVSYAWNPPELTYWNHWELNCEVEYCMVSDWPLGSTQARRTKIALNL